MIMSPLLHPLRAFLCFSLLAAWLLPAPQASAQMVVYRMEFERKAGFNDRPFTGGYFVAPVVGGTGSFVFTQGTGGSRVIVPAQDSGKLFRLVTEDREVKWVAQAQAGSAATSPPPVVDDDDGTDDGSDDPQTPVDVATGTFLAYGDANLNTSFRTPLLTFETTIAKSLEGRHVSSSSEAANGSTRDIGFVSRGEWRLEFDSRQTEIVNRDDMDLPTATEYLVELLQGPDDGSGGGGGGTVDRRLFILTSSPLPTAVRNFPYTIDLESSGGVPPRIWSIASGSTLPAGLTLTGAGRLSGTPTAPAATYPFTLVLSDSGTTTPISRAYTLKILDQLTITTTSPLASGNKDIEYGPVNLAAAGGTGTLTWTINSGSPPLPAGLTLSSTGVISGTPTEEGTFSLTIRVTDSGAGSEQQTTTKNFDITIDP